MKNKYSFLTESMSLQRMMFPTDYAVKDFELRKVLSRFRTPESMIDFCNKNGLRIPINLQKSKDLNSLQLYKQFVRNELIHHGSLLRQLMKYGILVNASISMIYDAYNMYNLQHGKTTAEDIVKNNI